ncbi:Cell division control protein 6 homolog [Linum grandiflorum]
MPSLASLTVSQSGQDSLTTPQKRRLRSNSNSNSPAPETPICLPTKRKSPRRCIDSSPHASATRSDSIEAIESIEKVRISLIEGLSSEVSERPSWNPRDTAQVSAVKEALHVSTAPATVVCREDEQRRVFDFCKESVEKEQSGSLYVCGCPGTGKSLSMEKVSNQLIQWAKDGGVQSPEVLSINCTALTSSSQIFSKILDTVPMKTKISGTTTPLQHLQKLYSQPQQSKMLLIVADELDYLITKDRAVLHDLFMLTTLPFSRCILIGIANAIDLADRFLPKLRSLNCKPLVITFKAYSKDQILRILQERLMALPHVVFNPQVLELCARRVAAASGDMRKALSVCRTAVEVLEAELRDSTCSMNPSCLLDMQEKSVVKVDHMAAALSKAFPSPLVDTIQSLPHHQQIILCSAVKFFRGGKKDTVLGELNKSYVETCKSRKIPPVAISEFLSMCRVLHDQGLVKLGQSRGDDKSKRVTLTVDPADISFALRAVSFFRNCLEQ